MGGASTCYEYVKGQNREPIAQILKCYIHSLTQILEQVEQADQPSLHTFFATASTYRDSISDRAKGPITPDYSFSVDIVDEPGAISTISVILAAKGINIKNIGINNNREQGEGALRITFYEQDAMKAAWAQLDRYHYGLLS